MKNLSVLERDILATLEEAGECDFAALLNTVRENQGFSEEIDQFRAALGRLIEHGFLEIAQARDKASMRWIHLPKRESLWLVTGNESRLSWSEVEHFWNFPIDSPRFQVVSTEVGLQVAREILSKDGWPVKRPWGKNLGTDRMFT